MTATKAERLSAILQLVNHGSAHTQHEIAAALARRAVRATQATISRDIQELGLVRSGAGYRSSTPRARDMLLCTGLVELVAVHSTPPGPATLVGGRIDDAAQPGVAGMLPGLSP